MPPLPPGEARARFGAARVARLATVTPDGRPHLVPIVFALDGDLVLSAVDDKPKRSGGLQRLRNLRAHPGASVLVDHYVDDWDELWWVRADGQASLAVEGPAYERAVRLLRQKYAQYRSGHRLGAALLIEIGRWTSWSSRG